MIVSGTEKDVLRAVARLGKAGKNEISRAVGFTIDYIELICNYLIRKGCLVKFDRYYMLTEEGERVFYFLEGKSSLIDKGSIKDLTGVAEQIAKKVIAEIKAKEIKTKRVRVYSKEKRVYPEKKREIHPVRKEFSNGVQIKTDFDWPLEDESLALESNINKVGAKLEKEKSDIDKAIGLLKNIQKKR